MNGPKIDEAILATTEPRWLKVAKVIGDVADQLGVNGDDELNAIARRVLLLVNKGRLEARGLIKYWRNSEIRIGNDRAPKDGLKQKEWKYAQSALDFPLAEAKRKAPN